MRKVFLLFWLLIAGSNVIKGLSVSDAWDVLISAVNGMPTANAEVIRLNANVVTNTAKVESNQADLDALNAQVTEAQTRLEAMQNAASIAAQTSDVMLRGKMNNIINSTDTPFSVLWPDGTRTAVAAQSTVSVNKVFSQYKEGSLIGGIISIIPQVAGADITSSDAEADIVGLSYSLLFNIQGLNEAEFAYGALNHLSITRCKTGVTRAHTIYLDSSTEDSNGLIKDNELWAVDVTINSVDTDSGLVYPRFSTLYTNEFDATDTSVAPDVSTQTTWSKQTVLDESNAAVNLSTPAFTDKVWGDISSSAA